MALVINFENDNIKIKNCDIFLFNEHENELGQMSRVAGKSIFVVSETCSMTRILEELKWETLQKRRKDNCLILLYKGLKGKVRIPTDDLIPKNRRCRNQHSLVFQIPTASNDAYKKSFFPPTCDYQGLQGLECPP